MDFLIGKKVKLVKFTKDNITDEYIEWLNNPRINKYLYTGRFPMAREDINLQQSQTNMMFAIMAKSLDSSGNINIDSDFTKHIGNISLRDIDWIARRGDTGYLIGNENYWGKGIATEIVGLITDYGFLRINLNKIYAGVVEGNIASEKSLMKNGYRHYARIPQEFYLDGKYLDANMYYKLQQWHLEGNT